MSLLRIICERIAAALENFCAGRRALRELHFAKYEVAPRQGQRIVQERLLRRMRKI